MQPTRRTCSVDSCDKPARARGMCNLHYKRMRRGASLDRPEVIKFYGSAEDRFWPRVDKSGTGGCWLWTGTIGNRGYGQIGVRRGSRWMRVLAHRFAWRSIIGEIPEGMLLDHICHVRHCVNPDHLRVVSNKQNIENRAGLNRNNTSGYPGVFLDRRTGKWFVRVTHDGSVHGAAGTFDDPTEAAEAARNLRNQLFTHNDRDRLAGATGA